MRALVEAAPGASRALVMDGETIVEAHLDRADEALPVGLVAPARLVERQGPRATVQMADTQALAEPAPADWRVGETRLAQVVRALRDDGVRDKQARVALHDGPAAPAPDLASRLAAAGHHVEAVRLPGPDLLGAAGWDEVVEEALSGRIDFPGGRLLIAPTPAMLVIDIDGPGDAAALAQGAARAVAAAVRRHGIGGPIVVDFPSLGGRGLRAVVDAILAEALPTPFVKTAMNGFGLVQVIRPRTRRSLIEEVRRPGFAALELIRRAARHTGALTISARAPVIDWLAARPDLLAQAERLCGGRIALLASDAAGRGHVQTG